MSSNTIGLYIHIPFCTKKCDYCDFVSFTMDEKAQQEYLDALCAEIDYVKRNFNDETFDTIYIGGGTPSTLSAEFITKLTRKLYSSFHFADYVEYTLEVNPESFDRTKFLEYVKSGVNRISVGVQCLNEALLAKIGRKQSNSSVEETFKLFNQSAFLNVSGDLMIGLPGQTKEDVLRTLDFLIDNNTRHISVYGLQVEEGTNLYKQVQDKKLKVLSDDKVAEYYDMVYKELTAAGYNRYEVSNFAIPGFESIHNSKYWDDSQYLGLGVAAHSYIDGYRYSNTRNFEDYINRCKNKKSAIVSREYVSDKTRRTERIMLSLRTANGIDLELFKKDFNEDILRSREEQINKLQSMGMVEVVDGYLRITEPNFYLSNSIILELL